MDFEQQVAAALTDALNARAEVCPPVPEAIGDVLAPRVVAAMTVLLNKYETEIDEWDRYKVAAVRRIMADARATALAALRGEP